MLLQDKRTGDLIKVADIDVLIDPIAHAIQGQIQSGQEEQDPEEIEKSQLVFPSGEALPRCWVDADYRK